ncbi:MAG: hypothetical protein LBJ71_02410 [Holosporaceae bacterium]|jgi:hypothetical protein|nr:hypothetical protein [Holosporaceae bacterium]
MLSRQSLDILIDLVEIKLSAIMILDKDDVREVERLKTCRNELLDFKRTMYLKKTRNDRKPTSAIL